MFNAYGWCPKVVQKLSISGHLVVIWSQNVSDIGAHGQICQTLLRANVVKGQGSSMGQSHVFNKTRMISNSTGMTLVIFETC